MTTLELPKNALCTHPQTISFDKIITLIGENGSGKSYILQSIFEMGLSGQMNNMDRIVCFSSGQNERFSKKFSEYIEKSRNKKSKKQVNCFYYDKSWSKLLIFLASVLKQDGKTRTFLREKKYIDESNNPKHDDISTTLKFSVRIDSNYIKKIKSSRKREERGETKNILTRTPFYLTLVDFIQNTYLKHYDFDKALEKKEVSLDSQKIYNISFDHYSDYNEAENQINNQGYLTHRDPTVLFITQAADENRFIIRNSCKLTFKNNIELDQLSDGEYQLLFLYSMIDLFDTQKTLFLLDEADSHLHYKNLEKLWKTLHNIQGKLITTTHLFDSILANSFDNIQVIENGEFADKEKTRHLAKRLENLSRANTACLDIWRKIPHIVLMDDFNDWTIFKKLAKRKGLDTSKLETLHCIKSTSNYNSTSQKFGQAKIDWVHKLCQGENNLQTSHIFLICDCDDAPLQFNNDGVLIKGQKSVKDFSKNGPHVYLLAWKRREIKNYLLSFTALSNANQLEKINNDSLALRHHLKQNDPGDNDSIRRLAVKDIITPLISIDGDGLDQKKLDEYISMMPSSEISQDIENMYRFLTEKLAHESTTKHR